MLGFFFLISSSIKRNRLLFLKYTDHENISGKILFSHINWRTNQINSVLQTKELNCFARKYLQQRHYYYFYFFFREVSFCGRERFLLQTFLNCVSYSNFDTPSTQPWEIFFSEIEVQSEIEVSIQGWKRRYNGR